MANPDKIDYTHGDTGERPIDGEDFQSGEAANPETHDWLFYTIPRKIDAIISRLNILDSDGDGVVDEADFANDADASTYKGNDIDTSGNGVVDQAAQATNADDADKLDGNEGTHYLLNVEDDGTVVTSDVVGIDAGTKIAVADNGDGTVTLSVVNDADTHVGVDDDSTTVINDPSRINFGTNISVTDNGDGTVTVTASGDADTLDGKQPSFFTTLTEVNNNADVPNADFADSAGSADIADEATSFETLTTDPTDADPGDMWYRTDLD